MPFAILCLLYTNLGTRSALSLPIQRIFSQVQQQLSIENRLILQAPPGAGKSTWLPLNLLNEPWLEGKKILMLEPRRLAARSIATFLAEQLGEALGETIGYAFRGDRKVSAKTRLEIVTEGLLIRKIQADPELEDLGLIIFDEFHERSLYADFGLAMAIEVQQSLRDDLRLLVMSATLDNERLKSFFSQNFCACEGRSYPVDTHYLKADKNSYVDVAEKTCLEVLNNDLGSVLIFLPGQREIQELADRLTLQTNDEVLIAPIYGQLDKKAQLQAIQPPPEGIRKVVLATNIAETSLTIEGISVVIDSGYQRSANFNLRNGITKLTTTRISQAAATQRAGRAGRTQAGTCYRLWLAENQHTLVEHDKPEILTSDISALLLETLAWGTQLNELALLDYPTASQLRQAQDLLTQLGALVQGKLSTHGQSLAALGCHPRIGNMLLTAKQHGQQALGLACYLAALLEESRFTQLDIQQQLNIPPPHFVKQRAKYWADKLNSKAIFHGDDHWLGILLAAAYPDRIAQRRGKSHRFLLANGYGCSLRDEHQMSQRNYLVVADILESNSAIQGNQPSQNEGRILAASHLNIDDVTAFLPHLIEHKEQVDWQEKQGKLVAFKRTLLGKLVLNETPINDAITANQRAKAFIQQIENKGLSLLNWTSDSEQLLLRLKLLNKNMPELQMPDLSKQWLAENVDDWLEPYLSSVNSLADLKGLNLKDILLNKLDYQQQQQLAELVPTHYKVPTGNNYKITYQPDKAPTLSVKMQEMYGESQTPTVCKGQQALLIELLSPAQRPLQVTQDLLGFWNGSYAAVQKEMKGRYPKHFWPDDPANAQPTHQIKSRM